MKEIAKTYYGDIFFSSPAQTFLTKEEILSQFDKLECILDRKSMDYLYSLYKLRISAFALDENMDDLELGFIVDTVFFRRLVTYNLYNKYLKLIDDDSYPSSINKSDHIIESNIFKILSKPYDESLCKLDYNYGFTDMYLYKHIVTSFADRRDYIKKKIEELSLMLETKKLERNPHRSYNMGNSLTFGRASDEWIIHHKEEVDKLQKELDKYSSLTDEDIRDMYEKDVFIGKKRNRILNYILNDCNLDLNIDFNMENNNPKTLIKKYGYANLHITNTREI